MTHCIEVKPPHGHFSKVLASPATVTGYCTKTKSSLEDTLINFGCTDEEISTNFELFW